MSGVSGTISIAPHPYEMMIRSRSRNGFHSFGCGKLLYAPPYGPTTVAGPDCVKSETGCVTKRLESFAEIMYVCRVPAVGFIHVSELVA